MSHVSRICLWSQRHLILNFFRQVFEVIDLMKLDMANFTLQQARPLIQQHAVEYERAKFEDFLKVQEGTDYYSLLYHVK